MKKTHLIIFMSIIVSGCSYNTKVQEQIFSKRIDSLTSIINNLHLEIKTLKHELENGEQSIVEHIQSSLNQNQYIKASKYIDSLLFKYPETHRREYYEKQQSVIESKVKKQILEIEKNKKDSIELANINNTGIWRIRTFVDSFGEPTREKYISTTSIHGTFSNTATDNSDLNIDLIIPSKNRISIQLYEYGGNNPVKNYETYYTLKVRDKEGKDYKLSASNINSDRLTVYESTTLHNIFSKGGTIKFLIYDSDRPSTRYNFTIYNADWYSNAYKQLIRK